MVPAVAFAQSHPRQVDRFAQVARRVRRALGPGALAVHHVGATSVPGTAAVEPVEVQITVASLDGWSWETMLDALAQEGFAWVERVESDACPVGAELDAAQLEKRLFLGRDPVAQLHVRVQGRYNQLHALVCRDYLRAHPRLARAYATVGSDGRTGLSSSIDGDGASDPLVELLHAGSRDWADATRWVPPSSDA
jgi:GrpB-like predicted nucleotidyltransferase (UPF0157 family)